MRQLDDGIGDTLVLAASTSFMGRSVRPLYTKLAVFSCLFGSLAALTRDNVGRVPARPVVLRSGRLVFAVMVLSLLLELGECRDVSPRPGSRVVTS
jgi:NADH:ubiquinone oxidoreductase subunit 2 (subunit N)